MGPPKLNLPIPPKNDPPKLNAPPISSLTSKKEVKNDTPVVMRQAVSIVDVPPESNNSTNKVLKIFEDSDEEEKEHKKEELYTNNSKKR